MRRWRTTSILPSENLHEPATVIGVGGIGSWTALLLAKLGLPKLELWDPDVVEPHNIELQFFPKEAVGKAKVLALKEELSRMSDAEIITHQECFNGEPLPITISGVDSMASREAIWEVVRFNPKVKLYIDARMGGETFTIFALRPTQPNLVKSYEESLHSDEEALPLPCTAQGISYNTFAIAAQLGFLVKSYLVGDPVPFNTIYDFPTYYLERR